MSNTVEDLAYIAGIVDGEGCITITMVKSKENRAGVKFYPSLLVTNTDESLLDFIHSHFTYFSKKTPHTEGVSGFKQNKPCFRLTAKDQRAGDILKELLPYLRVKKDQAKLAIHVCEIRKECGAKNYSDYDLDLQYDIYKQIRILNNSDDGSGGNPYASKHKIPPKPTIRPHRNGPQATKGYSKTLGKFFSKCQIEDCLEPHYAMGYCRRHHRHYNLKESKTLNEGSAIRECRFCDKDINHLRIDRTFCCISCKMKWHRRNNKTKEVTTSKL